MRILFIHAHFDDYEFTAAGTFERWRRALGKELRARVIVCTDGRAGHHFRTRAETGRMRLREQRASARIGGYEFDVLRYPDGTVPREACLSVDRELLAGLWKAIRDFEPDYLFCPPLPLDPLAGVHVDHVAVAEAVRKVAYMINVPHAFTPEYPEDERRSGSCKVPVILTTYDGYMHGGNAFDLAVDVTGVFETIRALTWCHQSQIREWIPWVGRHHLARGPETIEEWSVVLRERFMRQQRDLGIRGRNLFEVFNVTAWGEVPTYDQLLRDLPGVVRSVSHLGRLRARLKRWRGG
jgi:LmbE family N-acetylglucosaminyl deacetylase